MEAKALNCPKAKQNCGGCTLGHLPYEAQLKQKNTQMQKLFANNPKLRPIIGSAETENYRCKVTSTFAYSKKDGIYSGIYAKDSHKVIRIKECALHHKLGDKAVQAALFAAKTCRLPAFNEDKRSGLLRHVVVRVGKYTGQVMVTVVTAAPDFPGVNNFVKVLREQCPEVTTVVQNINPTFTSAVLGNREKILYGKGYISDTLCGMNFRISPTSFYQVNPDQTQVLYETALKLAGIRKGESVLDTYCGTGTIGLIASKQAKNVVGVEINSHAVKDAIVNAKINKAANIRFVCADAEKFMLQTARERRNFDCVIMDPPRSGSTRSFMDALGKMKPSKVLYISCNPETQVRDIRYLQKYGYKVQVIQPVDLFPHTEHTECIVMLKREH